MAFVEHLEGGGAAMVSALDSHVTRNRIALSDGFVALIDHNWRTATSDVWHSNAYAFNYVHSRRSREAHAAYLNSGSIIHEPIGKVMLVPPGHTVRSGTSRGRQRTLLCVLGAGLVESILGRPPRWTRTMLAEGLHLRHPEVEAILFKIYDELQRPRFGQNLMIETMANALVIATARALRLHDEEDESRLGGLSPWRMRLIKERVHCDGPLPSLTELAVLCGMSVRQLTRSFRIDMDMTVSKFIEQAMAGRARQLLEDTDSLVTDIATALGFSSCSSFTFAFKRATGVLPSQVRHIPTR